MTQNYQNNWKNLNERTTNFYKIKNWRKYWRIENNSWLIACLVFRAHQMSCVHIAVSLARVSYTVLIPGYLVLVNWFLWVTLEWNYDSGSLVQIITQQKFCTHSSLFSVNIFWTLVCMLWKHFHTSISRIFGAPQKLERSPKYSDNKMADLWWPHKAADRVIGDLCFMNFPINSGNFISDLLFPVYQYTHLSLILVCMLVSDIGSFHSLSDK